jgi:hypothetical protein
MCFCWQSLYTNRCTMCNTCSIAQRLARASHILAELRCRNRRHQDLVHSRTSRSRRRRSPCRIRRDRTQHVVMLLLQHRSHGLHVSAHPSCIGTQRFTHLLSVGQVRVLPQMHHFIDASQLSYHERFKRQTDRQTDKQTVSQVLTGTTE